MVEYNKANIKLSDSQLNKLKTAGKNQTYFKDNYKLIAADLSTQKTLDANPRVIQQIVFQGIGRKKLRLYTVLEKSKETVFKFYKGTAKVL